MYFSLLHKKTPGNCSLNLLKKRFFGPFRVLEFFSTVRNDRIFHFSRTLPETWVGIKLCILVDDTRKHPKIAVSMSSKKDFWVRFGFSTVRKYRIFLFSRTLPETCVDMNFCILVDYARKHPKKAVSMSSKKDFLVRFGFSIFFRLFETTEFFFFLGLFKRLESALTYVFLLITQAITR